MKTFLCKSILLLYCCCCQTFAQKVIYASEYGVKPNTQQDMALPIRKALDACQKMHAQKLILPQGRIDIWSNDAEKRTLYLSNSTENDTLSKIKSIAFLLENYQNFSIEGQNTLVVLHGKMVSFALLNSRNIQIKNLRFDYERPTMSELTLLKVTPTEVDAEVHPDSKYKIYQGSITFWGEGWEAKSLHTILFRPQSNEMHYSSMKPLQQAKVVAIAPNQLHFEGDFSKVNFQQNDILTFRDPYRDNCGAFIHLSKNILLENISMHYMHGLGILSQFSENLTLRHISVKPQANSHRIVAAFADCFHFSGCKGLVKIENCETSGAHDDPINVHGTHLQITKILAPQKLVIRFMHHQTYGFKAFFEKDSIAFINPATLLPIGFGKIKSAKLINPREMEVELFQNVPSTVQIGQSLENLTWTPSVIIQNCRFERTNTRGILMTTPRKVVIQNNVFKGTGMYPILIADDAASWYESGAVKDVLIQNNVFENCGYNTQSGAIAILPENHETNPIQKVHRNIRIINNTFKISQSGVLQAKSVDKLIFSNNTIIPLSPIKEFSILLTSCKNVSIENNKSTVKEKIENKE